MVEKSVGTTDIYLEPTVKQVFGKAGVTSRGELVAKLFAEHYGPDLHSEPVPHVQI